MLISFALTPISYRGYVYTSLDSKHCYYYLGSRFYSPLLSRFMNADSIPDTGTGVVGTNIFAYCNNNPVGFIDPDGKKPFSISKIMKRVVSLLSALIEFVYGLKKNIVMIVYNRPEHDFCDQADWMHKIIIVIAKLLKNMLLQKMILLFFTDWDIRPFTIILAAK